MRGLASPSGVSRRYAKTSIVFSTDIGGAVLVLLMGAFLVWINSLKESDPDLYEHLSSARERERFRGQREAKVPDLGLAQ